MNILLASGVLAPALQAKPHPGFDPIKKLEGSWQSTERTIPVP